MSKSFTPGPTAYYGCTQSPAPVHGCIEATAGNPIHESNKDIYDAKQCHASFFLFRKPTGKRKIISKYELPLQQQLPSANCQLPTAN